MSRQGTLAGGMALAAATALAIPCAGNAATITVDTADGTAAVDGACSLPEAIRAANKDRRRDGCRAGAGADRIAFDIAGPSVIAPDTQLPDVKRRATIDGTTEPDFVGSPVVQLDGDGGVITGLETTAARVTIKGLAVTGFLAEGLRINGARNRIRGNLVGLSPAGADEGNGVGISLESGGNVVGGPGGAARNVISGNGAGGGVVALGDGNRLKGNYIGVGANGLDFRGNDGNGVTADGDETVILDNISSGNLGDGIELRGNGGVVRGNLIGLRGDGDSLLGNTIGIDVQSKRNLIGGPRPDHRNLISASDDQGVLIRNAGAGRNVVAGNRIGTDATGTLDRGNDNEGVLIQGSNRNLIGGDDPREANLISGNEIGVGLSDTSGNVVSGNLIGTDPSATTGLGNLLSGVRTGAETSDNTIGGTASDEANTIRFNGGPGVNVAGGEGTSILGNSIFANAGRGIDLANDSVTPNDAGDLDSGPNGLQNFPEVEGYNAATGRLRYSLDSAPNTRFRIELFLSGEEDASGFGEGDKRKRMITVKTDGTGGAEFRFDGISAQFKVATATATELGPDGEPGSTSEFSAFVDVSPP